MAKSPSYQFLTTHAYVELLFIAAARKSISSESCVLTIFHMFESNMNAMPISKNSIYGIRERKRDEERGGKGSHSEQNESRLLYMVGVSLKLKKTITKKKRQPTTHNQDNIQVASLSIRQTSKSNSIW